MGLNGPADTAARDVCRLLNTGHVVLTKWSRCLRSVNLTTASGVTVADVCKTTYEEIKKDKKHRYVIFYIKDERQIDVEVIGPRDAAYDAFLEDLQKGGSGECRYGLFDFEYTHQCQGTSEASKKQKLFLMSWCPDTAKVKKKMLYSSSFDALKKSLVGVQKYIQATDLSEASEEAVEEKLRATDRN
ncbi:Cofilin/actin-depolymerizing factor-like protein [Temnothorax longispinosus]|uniref:Cofilin/actin-depolymerizing factor-like protein n=1 Tax=Temnothorax longispinosus TaxID=300112 RepID=A0A4S2KMT5_9HYME|nr:Cofilin/actin-depolymerizing factor-like protein [Temnothorax longispinosus]